MSLQDWQKNGWIRAHRTSAQEIASLLAVVERDVLASGNASVDVDWRFAIAYNAALQAASVALKACGFEVPKGGGAHQRTIESLRLTLEEDGIVVDALQQCRARRGGGIYEATDIASDAEVAELRELAIRLRDRVRAWLKKNHPTLIEGVASRKSGRRK